MPNALRVTPPSLIPWIPPEEKKHSLVLLDLEADKVRRRTLHFDLNVVFNPIPVRRGVLQQADWYVGTCGGEVSIEFLDGSITGYTPPERIAVDHANSTSRTRISAFTIEAGGKQVTARPASLSLKAGASRVFTCRFSCEERVLTPIHMGNLLKWVVDLPRGEKAVRDFLIGNLYLFVDCLCESNIQCGRIVVRPSAVRFFDPERRPAGKLASIALAYTLWRRGMKVRNGGGLEISFEVRL